MSRFMAIARRSLANSVSTMLIYRGNLVFFLMFESMFLAAHFLTIGIGFSFAGGEIAGWTSHEAYLLTALSGLTHQFFICFFINPLFMLPQHVWSGQYDYVLMKPLHPLLASWATSETSISNLPNLLINLGLVLYFATTGPGEVAMPQALACIAALVCGLSIRVAFAMLCVAPVFLSERLVGVEETYWSISSLGRYPLTVFPQWLDRFLTFVLPMAAVAYLPAGALYGKLPSRDLGLGMLASVVFSLLCYKLFMSCVRRYQSVNSGV
jgi:ABC-2 type transport system permease protein